MKAKIEPAAAAEPEIPAEVLNALMVGRERYAQCESRLAESRKVVEIVAAFI